MEVKKEYIQTAVNEFKMVKNVIAKLQGKRFDAVANEMNKAVYGTVHNYDGELFDFCLSRILGTVYKGKNKTSTLDNSFMFDISDDLSGEWIDTTIEELKKILDEVDENE